MKMFKFKDLQNTMSFYGHCSFTYLWNMHLIQLHDGIHNSTVVNKRARRYRICRTRSAALFCISPARPSDCPHLSVHLSHGLINQKRLVKIMQFILSLYCTHCIGQQLVLYLALLSCSLCYVKLHVVHVLLFGQIKKERRKEFFTVQ